jgi:hypothetical protein
MLITDGIMLGRPLHQTHEGNAGSAMHCMRMMRMLYAACGILLPIQLPDTWCGLTSCFAVQGT